MQTITFCHHLTLALTFCHQVSLTHRTSVSLSPELLQCTTQLVTDVLAPHVPNSDICFTFWSCNNTLISYCVLATLNVSAAVY